MQSVLDQAISDVAGAEGVYSADALNLTAIQTSIAQATSPLAPAQAKLSLDASDFVAKLQALSAAALAQAASLAPAPVPAVVAA